MWIIFIIDCLLQNIKTLKYDNGKINVTFFQRKPRRVGNYSVEFIFDDVRYRLKNIISARTVISRYESNGLFKRLYNCIQAAFSQNTVNHVTGDVNYLGIFLTRNKTIHTILDCVFMTSTSGFKKRVIKYFWLTIPVRRSKYITAISEATKNEIIKYSGCKPEKVKVIHVAISDRFKKRDKIFNKEKPVILQIGAASNKNISRLIKALKGLSCELHIIGKHIAEYENLLKEYDIDYKYEYGLTEDQMIEKYEHADIISLISTYEGFGMPILEAQSVGRAVITSNISSMPEVAGGAACLVDPYNIQQITDGLTMIIQNDEYRGDLIQKGYKNVQRFKAQDIAIKYYDLYKEVAEN